MISETNRGLFASLSLALAVGLGYIVLLMSRQLSANIHWTTPLVIFGVWLAVSALVKIAMLLDRWSIMLSVVSLVSFTAMAAYFWVMLFSLGWTTGTQSLGMPVLLLTVVTVNFWAVSDVQELIWNIDRRRRSALSP